MSEHPAQPSYGAYLVIWVWLIALLAAGTFVSRLPIGRTGVVLVILAIALVKTVLVGLFYMHLKAERSAPIWVIVFFPFLLVGAAVLLVLPGILLFS